MRNTAAFIFIGVLFAATGCRGGSKPPADEAKVVTPPAAAPTAAEAAPTTPAGGVEVCRAERWIMIDLVPSQLHAYDTQVEANRRGGGRKVTIHFTSGQLDAIRGAFPACRKTSLTWDERCIFECRVALRFDEQDRIITPAAPYTSR